MDKIFLYREEAFYTHHQKSSFQLKKERKKEKGFTLNSSTRPARLAFTHATALMMAG